MGLKSELDYKKKAIQAAKELYYGQDVVKQLKAAKSESEVQRIMISARRKGNRD